MHTLQWILDFFLVFAAIMVAFSNNPISSVIFLIAAFCTSAFLLFLFSVDFLGIVFVLIYVGAIAVLFLFVIMMLNIKIQERKIFALKKIHLLFFAVFSIYTMLLLFFGFFECFFSREEPLSPTNYVDSLKFLDNLNNTDVLAQVLFNHTILCFLIAGLILLVSLVGSIILTQEFNRNSKKQLIPKQLSRSSNIINYCELNFE